MNLSQRQEPSWELILQQIENGSEPQLPLEKLAARLYIELNWSLCYGGSGQARTIPFAKMVVLTSWANEIFHRLCKLSCVWENGQTDEERLAGKSSDDEEDDEDERARRLPKVRRNPSSESSYSDED